MTKVYSSLLAFIFILLPSFAFAAKEAVISLKNPLNAETFEQLLDAVINWLLILALPIVVLLIVFAGVQFMLGGVSPEQRKNSLNMIKYALLGYTVILLSRAILGIIQAIFS